MKIVPRPISGASLVSDYLAAREPALGFYGGLRPDRLDSYRAKTLEVEPHFDRAARERLAAHLGGGGEDARERLRSFVEEGGFAVTTGQQPGLLGGPLFELYKALSAAALARRLQGALGRPVIPVFWLATQDHDWEEVRRTHLPDMDNELASVELALPEGMPAHSFHQPELSDALPEARTRLLEALPTTDFSEPYRAMLDESHGEARGLADAEEALLQQLLAPAGVFILRPDRADPARAALPVLLAELSEASERETAVGERGRALEEAGYALQVPLMAGGVNLFVSTDRGRERLFRTEDGGFHTRGSDRRIPLSELRELVQADPARLTPNVLLRPVVESTLVPTLAYVAGPGETAYFPQTAPLFAAAGRTPPIVHPRLSAVLIESKVEKVVEKFGLELDQLSRPHHELAGDLTRDEIPSEVRSAIGGLRGELARRCREVADAVAKVDPTLKGSVDGVRRQGFSALDDLEKKVTQALKRENEIALQQLEKAQLHLFPQGTPQERVISPFYYLFRYGHGLFEELEASAESALLPSAAAPDSERPPASAGSTG